LPPPPDVNPGLFRVYVHLVYTGELLSQLYWGFGSDPEPEDDFKLYSEIYLLADDLGDFLNSTIVLEKMIERLDDWPEIHWTRISKIWARTDRESLLRAFLLHWMVNSWSRDYITKTLDEGDLPDEFVPEALPIALSLIQPMPNSQCEKELGDVLF
jgi:hypothetical protein